MLHVTTAMTTTRATTATRAARATNAAVNNGDRPGRRRKLTSLSANNPIGFQYWRSSSPIVGMGGEYAGCPNGSAAHERSIRGYGTLLLCDESAPGFPWSVGGWPSGGW